MQTTEISYLIPGRCLVVLMSFQKEMAHFKQKKIEFTNRGPTDAKIWLTCVSLDGHNEQRVQLAEFSRKLGPVCFFIQNYLFIFQMFCFYESAARLL